MSTEHEPQVSFGDRVRNSVLLIPALFVLAAGALSVKVQSSLASREGSPDKPSQIEPIELPAPFQIDKNVGERALTGARDVGTFQ